LIGVCFALLPVLASAEKEEDKEPEPPFGVLAETDAVEDGYLHAVMEGNRLKVRFLDEDYKEVESPYIRGYVHVQPAMRKREFSPLVKDGNGFRSQQVINPPHIFTLYINLFKGEADSDGGELVVTRYNSYLLEQGEEED